MADNQEDEYSGQDDPFGEEIALRPLEKLLRRGTFPSLQFQPGLQLRLRCVIELPMAQNINPYRMLHLDMNKRLLI